jgi:hypothetical protein
MVDTFDVKCMFNDGLAGEYCQVTPFPISYPLSRKP